MASDDYNQERDALEESLPSALHIDREHLEAFMEELTNLVRKYNLLVNGSGDIDIFDVVKLPFHELQQGRYVIMFDDKKPDQFSPVPIVWGTQSELSLNTIDIDKL